MTDDEKINKHTVVMGVNTGGKIDPYQITLYVDKEQYKKFRAILVLADKSVSQWVRDKIEEELSDPELFPHKKPSNEPQQKEENDEQSDN